MGFDLPPTVRWVLLALLGLLVAIAVGIAASELTSRRIGLSSEPLSAGEALAPQPERAAPEREPRRPKKQHAEEPVQPAEPPVPTTTVPTTTTTPTPIAPVPESTGETTTPEGGAGGEGSEDD